MTRAAAPRLGEPPSRSRMIAVPILSVMIASALPLMLPLVASSPVLPPLGLLLFLCWQLLRTELWPVWIGLPLGLWDDLFSGQPFGSAVLLWSLALIAIELIEARFPWRGFWQDWFTAGLAALLVWLAGLMVAGAKLTPEMLLLAMPQALLSVLLYPILARMVASLDRFRLARARRIG